MSTPPATPPHRNSVQLAPGPHAYRVWEAWTSRPDKNYNRYTGLEMLPEHLFFVATASRHGSWGVGNDTDWHILDARKALDRAHEHGVSLYASELEAIAAWDSAVNTP